MKIFNKSIEKTTVISTYNKEKQCWECKVKTKGFTRCVDDKYRFFKRKSKQNVIECDEFVAPWAILEHNGINTKMIDEAIEKDCQ